MIEVLTQVKGFMRELDSQDGAWGLIHSDIQRGISSSLKAVSLVLSIFAYPDMGLITYSISAAHLRLLKANSGTYF